MDQGYHSNTATADPVLTWGDGVRFLRQLHGYSQRQLADLAKPCTQAQICNLEKYSPRIADDLRVRIARALVVEPHVLFPYREDGAA